MDRTMTETTTKSAPERKKISCPGCGRHDWVTWPSGQPTLNWKCFNCSKEFELQAGSHH
jgi:DNA-directed RNA polymerase subunit RPC12/RpoP